ncbi:3-deoxy-manno-octulosonate cytidylyltransferase [Chrysiogenes arsenatis]|uniref:3-deoxy-manno-octulosonate cytidylyltransferase n=1 Tax=Chrysiogenes arsenatis TaxID=309797 RepID=UPI000420DCB7|nr:3-deoxy-manno-octulosonate cytidylyltransferase [Chrysiogenes arsenatis]
MHIIIPARYASTRFPGKPLVIIAGKPMIQWVYEQCLLVPNATVTVATDDERIADVVRGFGGNVALTSPECATGTDRVAEVAAKVDDEIIVNVQGDEPLINPLMIEQAVAPLLRDHTLMMGSLKRPFDAEENPDNPNIVKVVVGHTDRALYFSRSRLPFNRLAYTDYFAHVGLYVYRRPFLLDFVTWPRSPLEQAEELEQLRALERGYAISVPTTEYTTIGVDVPEDRERVERLLREKGV